MCRLTSRTKSTLLGLNSCTKQACKHLRTVIFIIVLLAPNLMSNPITTTCYEVRSKNFSENISNPCRGIEIAPLHQYTVQEIHRHRSRILNDTLPTLLNTAREGTQQLLNENTDQVCRNGYIQDPLNLSTLQGKEQKDALLDIYEKLLNHVWKVYYVYQQDVNDEQDVCANVRSNPSTFADRTRRQAAKLGYITCNLQLALLTYSVNESTFTNRSNAVLDMQVCDENQCGKRAIEDCSTIKSALSLLNTFISYLQQL